MLLSFAVENYKNFKTKQILYFDIETGKSGDYLDKDKIDLNTFEKYNGRFLKTIAIYGANGVGKTNIIKALFFVKNFILTAPLSTMPNSIIANDFWLRSFKLDEKTIDCPSNFELNFVCNNKQYKYFFSCNNLKVFKEKLEVLNTKTNEYNCIYDRKEKLNIVDEKLKKQTENIVNQLRGNSLFLSLIISANIDFAVEIQKFLTHKVIVIPSDATNGSTTIKMLENNERDKKEIINFLNSIDINVEDIKLEKINGTEQKNISFKRINNQNKNISFEYFEESLGTQKIFSLVGDILNVIRNGSILFLDELDCHLHIKLFKHLIEIFNKNKNGAQLVFTTHNTTILNSRYDLFRKDQILIINKEVGEESIIYSLVDENGIQKNANYEDLLLDGLVGGNPIIGGFNV